MERKKFEYLENKKSFLTVFLKNKNRQKSGPRATTTVKKKVFIGL